MSSAFITAAVRTPIGRAGGALAELRPDDLAAAAIAGLVRSASLPPDRIEDVILGCANQAGEDNRNVARMAALLAGLPVEVPGRRSTGSAAPASRPWRAPPTRSAPAKATCSSPAASRA